MPSFARALVGLGLLAFAAACAPQVEEVAVIDVPVSTEPVYTGAYK